MANGISIKLNGLDELKGKLALYSGNVKKNIGLAVFDAANNIVAKAKENLADNHSVITGSLVKSLRVDSVTPMAAKAGSDIVYAPDVEYGTAAHEITPKSGKCLAFEIDGKMVFVKRVHHPGNKAKPFFNPAVEETRPIYLNKLKEALKGD